MITNAFTCTGPYAILIMLGIKRVENRASRPVPEKGRCAISCSKSFCKEEYGEFVQWASRTLSPEDFERVPSWSDVQDWPGKIVGCCEYSVRGRNDLVLSPDGRNQQWDEGLDFFWDLSEVVCFDRPISCRGNQGMWLMPTELAREVLAADSLAQCVGMKIETVADAVRTFRAAQPSVGTNEGLFVLPLDADRCALDAPILISLGDSVTTIVQVGEVFSVALRLDAKVVIVAHNHPSGNVTPSLQDRQLTEVLVRQGEILGVKVLEHLILGVPSDGNSGFFGIIASVA